MKKYIFILLLFGSLSISAQTVNGIQLKEIPVKYIKVVSKYKVFNEFNITLYFDYGQITNNKDLYKGHLIDEDGNQIKFNGTTNVINYLEKRGYKFLNQYLEMSGSVRVIHTLFENKNYIDKN